MPEHRQTDVVVVRPATPADLVWTAREHRAHLPHGLFPHLGLDFVRRWHATFLTTGHGVALVAARVADGQEQPVGFLLGSTDQVRLVREVVRRHRWALGRAGLAALLRRPRLARHFVRSRGRAYGRRLLRPEQGRDAGRHDAGHHDGTPVARGTDDGRAGPVAVVAAVVVADGARGGGVGRRLVASFLDQARAAQATTARLTTLVGDQGAEEFYEALGWCRLGQHRTRDGLSMATYEQDLRAVPRARHDLGGA